VKAQSRESRKEFQNFDQSKSSLHIPNALLLTHAHDDHIKDLPILLNNVDEETSRYSSVICDLNYISILNGYYIYVNLVYYKSQLRLIIHNCITILYAYYTKIENENY